MSEPKFTFTLFNPDGARSRSLPSRQVRSLPPAAAGPAATSTPASDGNGITASEMAEMGRGLSRRLPGRRLRRHLRDLQGRLPSCPFVDRTRLTPLQRKQLKEAREGGGRLPARRRFRALAAHGRVRRTLVSGAEEISGLPPDPTCLHCVVAVAIGKFIDEHPGKLAGTVVTDLIQVLGEYIASVAPLLGDGSPRVRAPVSLEGSQEG